MINKSIWINKITRKDYGWLGFTNFLGFIGLVDVLRYLIVGTSLLHPLNDVLLIFSSLALSITVVMVVMER